MSSGAASEEGLSGEYLQPPALKRGSLVLTRKILRRVTGYEESRGRHFGEFSQSLTLKRGGRVLTKMAVLGWIVAKAGRASLRGREERGRRAR